MVSFFRMLTSLRSCSAYAEPLYADSPSRSTKGTYYLTLFAAISMSYLKVFYTCFSLYFNVIDLLPSFISI
jgi:hypothetical protein